MAFIINNLALFLAKSLFTLFGIFFIASSFVHTQFNKNFPPSLIPDVISYWCKYAGTEQATNVGLDTK